MMQAHVARDQVVCLAWQSAQEITLLDVGRILHYDFADRFGLRCRFGRVDALDVGNAQFLRNLICDGALWSAADIEV